MVLPEAIATSASSASGHPSLGSNPLKSFTVSLPSIDLCNMLIAAFNRKGVYAD
jgi:hypothetical protein